MESKHFAIMVSVVALAFSIGYATKQFSVSGLTDPASVCFANNTNGVAGAEVCASIVKKQSETIKSGE